MDVLLRIAGIAVLLVVIMDVFATVLFPSNQYGPVFKPLSRGIWFIFRFLGRQTSGQRRRNLLSYSGPVLIIATLVAWFFLIIVGWGMIYKPVLGTAVRATSGETDTGWATAIYFSGYNLTTLGVGDIVADNSFYRLLSVIQAASGFTFFSMVTTYFLSVYSSLTSRNAFAQRLHHLSGKTGDAAELLARLTDGPDLSMSRQHLSSAADILRQIYQTHRFYPVLHYFHYRESYYALPGILFIALESTALLRSALDREHYSFLIRSSAVNELFEAAMALLRELIPGINAPSPSDEDLAQWRERYVSAAALLAHAGIRIRDDTTVAMNEYVAHRREWDCALRELAVSMLYEWE